MKNILKKFKDLATYMHQSNVAASQLKSECKNVGQNYTAINQSNETRWDSQESCMSSILVHQICLENLARRGEEKFPDLVPTCSEFILMKGACVNLKKCKITTKIFEQEKVPTINLICDRIFTVMEELEAFIRDRNNRGSGVMFARQLKTEIGHRFPQYGTHRMENCFANYLDPVLKGLHLKAVHKFEQTVDNLEALVNEPVEQNNNQSVDTEVPAETPAMTPREKLKKKILAQEYSTQASSPDITNKQSQFRKECASYESLPDADNQTDRLQWWKHHEKSFPLLSKLARRILCIPAASSKSERVFSVGGNAVSAKRGRLGTFTVQNLILVACNMRLLKQMEGEEEFSDEELEKSAVNEDESAEDSDE